MRGWDVDGLARDFFAKQVADPQEYFVYFKGLLSSIAEKDPPRHNGTFPRTCPYKKGAGRIAIRPAWTPILL